MTDVQLAELSPDDIDAILDLERSAYVPYLRASEQTILKRFDLGHLMIGLMVRHRLKGMISFSYAHFPTGDNATFPKTFREFSTQPPPEDRNAVFIYSLGIEPGTQGRRHAKTLVFEVGLMAAEGGCRYVVADGRMPSYHGSTDHPQEHIRPVPELKAAVDRHLAGGRFPTQHELLRDPMLAFYHRMTGCQFRTILPNFIPEDLPSGGHRVILVGDRWRPPDRYTRPLGRLAGSHR